ncbi:methylmalonyl-CoA mutase subunit beta [Arenibacter sp. GZD96]|uniref:methylmalonyl-CoA mutase subunit beta n=1 Tax=Aurantibrevibacter litoralis TaxID=3106030 RepID=UPI002AFF3FA2|nr:methylmalonyl-CoA mutase subunit beta [Arenibacter sp. GZD-96]MEA1785066.1 methylmalonyl-CoA mutase subunit beta [Arenibacter sp. GZD-96]
MPKTDLFEAFDTISPKVWKQKIQFELDGADYANTLIWETPEGIKVKPFYTAEDSAENTLATPTNAEKRWKIGQLIYAGNAVIANKKAVEAVQQGAESLIFNLPSNEVPIPKVLQGLNKPEIPVHCYPQFLPEISDIKKLQHFTATYLCVDPIGHLAQTGNWFFNEKKDWEMLSNGINHGSNLALSVDSSLYQNAGANKVQQLAYALAHAHEYIHFLASTKQLTSCKRIVFKVAVGSHYFFEIAKLRALRQLWNTLASEYDISWECHILATPTLRNKTIYSYNTNMLRTTMECMAAIMGGADTISNVAYDAVYHKENDFGQRIARNQLLVLKHESYLSAVAHPADGSYYVESVTQQLAEKSLALFKSIEQGGGFLAQLKAHTIQKKIKENAAKEQQRFAEGKEVLVGTNAYALPDEKMKVELQRYPFVKTNRIKTFLEPIIIRRLAEVLEQKRLDHE